MRARIRYRGRVQGVGFRATASALSANFDVTGWVRNEHDGSVLLEAQGEAKEVEAFLTRLQQAMDRYIHAADRADVPETTDESNFRIAR